MSDQSRYKEQATIRKKYPPICPHCFGLEVFGNGRSVTGRPRYGCKNKECSRSFTGKTIQEFIEANKRIVLGKIAVNLIKSEISSAAASRISGIPLGIFYTEKSRLKAMANDK